ncbi:MAG: hypothetical protein KTR25_11165 [Myxococcales bacterium]|nr:hypothetical protein [Myxococcales bacterium]
MEVDDQALERILAISRSWRWAAMVRSIRLVAALALFLTSYALGYSYGPSSLQVYEFVGLALAALVFAALMSWRLDRRLQAQAAQARWKVREGDKSRQVLSFDTYILVDQEVILHSLVEKVQKESDRLIVRYRDAEAGGPRLREWGGHPEVLDALSRALRGRALHSV